MSQENVEIVRALIPHGTDIIPLLRDEGTFGGQREALGSVLTDDFRV